MTFFELPCVMLAPLISTHHNEYAQPPIVTSGASFLNDRIPCSLGAASYAHRGRIVGCHGAGPRWSGTGELWSDQAQAGTEAEGWRLVAEAFFNQHDAFIVVTEKKAARFGRRRRVLTGGLAVPAMELWYTCRESVAGVP